MHVKALPGKPAVGRALRRAHPAHGVAGDRAIDGRDAGAGLCGRWLSRSRAGAEIQMPGLHRQPEARRDADHPTRAAATGGHRTGDRASEGRPPHGPQLSGPFPGRCRQRHPGRRGLQLPAADQLDHHDPFGPVEIGLRQPPPQRPKPETRLVHGGLQRCASEAKRRRLRCVHTHSVSGSSSAMRSARAGSSSAGDPKGISMPNNLCCLSNGWKASR